MPLYEYRCHKCGQRFEIIQKFSDEPVKVHPECGGEVERLISAPALQFKGSGWYITDYAKSGSSTPPKESKDSKDSNGASDKKETKSDSSAKSESSSSSASSPSSSSSSTSDSGSKAS
jgi:putative FmdB family regulatory protein